MGGAGGLRKEQGKMYKELSDIEDTTGKTIKGITYARNSDQMIIAFADETFITFGVTHGYEEDEIYVYWAKLNFEGFSRDLIHSGIISPEEFEQKMDEIQEARREAEFRHYKILKAKFEEGENMASAQVTIKITPRELQFIDEGLRLLVAIAASHMKGEDPDLRRTNWNLKINWNLTDGDAREMGQKVDQLRQDLGVK